MNTIKILAMLSLYSILTSSSCNKERNESSDDKLTLERADYNGNELRINGYYYKKDSKHPQISVFFLYKNGLILYGSAFDIDYTNEMEERYRNGNYGNNSEKYYWGVFQIEGNKIKYEKWVPSEGPFSAFTYEGVILNDTTFVINKSYRMENGQKTKISELDWEYHFKQFSPKPDSTNRFIP
ncbi:MAG: hypothetical protein LBQ60_14125 [Bacteroidales bacterium]|jgi:hypothetical protein|nr:hypothetical protein [Bacteroidales bacterium]